MHSLPVPSPVYSSIVTVSHKDSYCDNLYITAMQRERQTKLLLHVHKLLDKVQCSLWLVKGQDMTSSSDHSLYKLVHHSHVTSHIVTQPPHLCVCVCVCVCTCARMHACGCDARCLAVSDSVQGLCRESPCRYTMICNV